MSLERPALARLVDPRLSLLVGLADETLPEKRVVAGFIRLSQDGIRDNRYEAHALRNALDIVSEALFAHGYSKEDLAPLKDYILRLLPN